MIKKFFLALLPVVAIPCWAEEPQPKWELGVGLGTYMAPHYLGADQSATYTLPMPFLVYRGDRIRTDRGGLLGRIYDSNVMDIRASIDGSLPVNSEDNDARLGMPDLDLMLEAGPTLQFHLFNSANSQLRFDIPVRAAFSIGDNIEYRGLLTNPRFYYSYKVDKWQWSSVAGPIFSSENFQDYFYEVESQYATPLRAVYNAQGGYTGLRTSLSVRRHFGSFFVGAFLNYYDLHHVKNADSPLMKKQDYLSASFAVVWIFAKSDHYIEAISID
jgi:MipA family protein